MNKVLMRRRIRRLERHIMALLEAWDASEMSNLMTAIARLRRDIDEI